MNIFDLSTCVYTLTQAVEHGLVNDANAIILYGLA